MVEPRVVGAEPWNTRDSRKDLRAALLAEKGLGDKGFH